MLSLPSKGKILSIPAKNFFEKLKLNFSCSALFHMKSRVDLKYFVGHCRYQKKKKKMSRKGSTGKITWLKLAVY